MTASATTPTTELAAHISSLPLDAAVLLRERAILVNALSMLDDRRNQLAFVSKLSPELVHEIFLCVAACTRVEKEDPKYTTPTKLRTLTHVCRRWREIAYGSARIWTFLIDFTRSTQEMEEGLRKTLGAPLHVKAVVARFPQVRANVLRALNSATERIEVLDLALQTADFNAIGPALVAPAPALTVFRIACDSGFVDIADGVFAGETPRLRELRLVGCVMSSSLHLLQRNLVHLSIDRMCPNAAFSVAQWLEVIKQCPMLETLSLTRCFKATRTTDSLPIVRLPLLVSLAIESRLFPCTDMLTQLDFPPTLRLQVKTTLSYFEARAETLLSDLVKPIANNFKGVSEADKFRAMNIEWRHTGVVFRGWQATDGGVAEFALTLKGDDVVSYAQIIEVITALPTDKVRVLDLRTPLCQCGPPSHFIFRYDHNEDWGLFLQRFPGVRLLREVKEDWALSALTVLRENLHLLLKLRKIEFRNASFLSGTGVCSMLTDLVAARANAIREVKLVFCKGVATRVREPLEALGVSVDWDGRKRYENEVEA
ncbi:RING-type domain-containing protein [Mycena kentingensis (nom. inval.)]|nr:RING-type domain-containing protein [Mycena kentingensis (nom. inval.)]